MTPREALRRLRYFLFRDRYTRELEEEMRLHRELRAQRLQGGGLGPHAARYAAQRKFGNSTFQLERSRDMWGMQWIDNIVADLRFALRRLAKRPVFTVSAIGVAALGIGATTAVFSAVDAAILRPLPFYHPRELVTLVDVRIPHEGEAGRRPDRRAPDLLDAQELSTVFSSVAAYASGGMNLEDATNPRRVSVGVVSSTFFPTLGVLPARGRSFGDAEGKPGGPRVVILSDALWRSNFGGDTAILGHTIMVHGQQYEIVGVMPPRFQFPAQSDLWIPMSVPTTPETFRPFRGYLPSTVIARIAPGVTHEAASARLLAQWIRFVGKPVPGRRTNAEVSLAEIRKVGATIPLQQDMVGGQRKALFILMGATLLLLLIASANIANLLVSDGASRRREVALRETLGASRGRIVRQLLVESVALAAGGASIGLALAPVTLGLMRALMPAELAGTVPIHVDARVLAFATVLALGTGIAFGLWPALGTARVDPAEVIKAGASQGSTSASLGRTRQVLIVSEVTLTVTLLIGAGLMLKSFNRLMTQDFGMNPDRVGTMELTFPRPSAMTELSVTGTPARRMQVIRSVLATLAADPRISAVGAVNDLPLRGGGGIGITITPDGMPDTRTTFPRYLIADGGFFKAMGIRVRGRTFTAGDDSIGQRVAIINQALADFYWKDVDPIGRTFTFPGEKPIQYTIIGVAANVREDNPDEDPPTQMYFSMEERGLSNLAIVAKSDLPSTEVLARLTGAVRRTVPTQAVFNVRMMNEVVGKSVAPRRTNTMLIAVFGGLALVLSAFGIYAVVSYSVTQRAREFGIRTALGARRSDILALVGNQMTKLLAMGILVGLGAAWGLTKVLASLLYEVDAHDFATFALVPVVLVIPAALATLLPSLRATRVSPTEVMRAE